MGLDLWFREDVARILAATAETMGSTLGAVAPLNLNEAASYREGFEDALRAVGVAFGVALPRAGLSRPDWQRERWPAAASGRVVSPGDAGTRTDRDWGP